MNLKRVAERTLVMLVAVAGLVLLGGCEEEENTTLLSPVQAVTTLLERDDGTVEAELVLISTAVNPHEYVDTADNVNVRVPSAALVGLIPRGDGHYDMDSTMNAELTYQLGETYRFTFDLEDDAAKQVSGGTFVAFMDAVIDAVTFTLPPGPLVEGQGFNYTFTPATGYAIISISDSNDMLVYRNFDFTEPQFNGSKWARLKTGGADNVSAGVLNDAGDYAIEVCVVDKVSDFDPSLSADLGVLSGFLIGRCAATQTLTVIQ